MRGQLTEEIESKSLELLGYKIDTKELRLMPYVQYVMVNEQTIDPKRVNEEELVILDRWHTAGFMESGAQGLTITKDFWNIINELIWMSYVSY